MKMRRMNLIKFSFHPVIKETMMTKKKAASKRRIMKIVKEKNKIKFHKINSNLKKKRNRKKKKVKKLLFQLKRK